MDFEKVKKEHILQGIKDYKEKGLPNEFGPSSTYDLVFEGEKYPPKAIMAYANYHAEGKEVKAYFKGGLGTDCFNTYEREGFVIEQKSNKLLETYLKEFALIADDWFRRQDWFQGTFDFFTNFYDEKNIGKAEWANFQELGNYIHAFKSMAIAKGNALGKPNLPIEEYRRIFKYIKSEEDPINVTINNLYKKYDGSAFLPFFSDSSISELIAYAFPDKYVVYNRRDVKALEILGISVPKVRAEKFGDTFSRYNDILNSVLEQYETIVGQRTNTTTQLELDQFFSWLYETKKADKPIKDLIQRYKTLIKSGGLDAEKYKWEFIRDFKGKPDLNDSNFEAEIKSIKFGNLLYHLSSACLKDMVSYDAISLSKEFEAMRVEAVDLDQRILNFTKNTLKIYKNSGGENSHHQDERSISVYLTLNDPSEYTFYKSSYYTKYCELLDVKVGKPKHKYAHYLELVKELAEDYISKDHELVELLHAELGDLIVEDPSFLLAAQDILYQLVGNERDLDYWVFQGNPKVYDFETAIKNNELDTWTVSAHKDKIKVGDKVILWITGEKSGCYALAEITKEPHERIDETDNNWKQENKSELKAGIKITHNFLDYPVLKEMIEDEPEFEKFNGGNQGSNFTATKEQYDVLLNRISQMDKKNYWVYSPGENAKYWEAFYSEGILGLGWNELGDISRFNAKEEIVKELQRIEETDGSKKNDATANWDFLHRISIGDVIIAKRGRQELLGYGIVTSDYYYDPTRKDQHHLRKIDWKHKGKWPIEHHLSLKTLTIITDYGCELPEFEFYYQRLLADMGVNVPRIKNKNMPINQILYGPPGTGKTYNTINKSLQILGENIGNLSREEIHKLFDSKVASGNIVFTTFHQSMSYEDFIEGIKPTTKENKVLYNVEDGLFKSLAEKARDNIEKSETTSLNFQAAFNQLKSEWEESEEGELEIKMKTISFHITDISEKYISFRKRSGGTGHLLVLKSLKELFNGSRTMNQGLAVYYYPLIDKLKSYDLKEERTELENFVLIVDEINRGNVSSIFGELITLIEEDKRIGNKEALEVVLPYSKERFGVPNNLYILGTMNTADRSVEALDTALRRRFSFVEMMPEPSLLSDKIDWVSLKELLETINQRIEALIDRDHTIGHAYFMNVKDMKDLRATFKDKIIPLLQEYFYGDYGKIGLVLGEGFVDVDIKEDTIFSSFQYEGRESLTQTSYTLKSFEDMDFEEALKQLFNKK